MVGADPDTARFPKRRSPRSPAPLGAPPEVVVKVSGGAQSLRGVAQHLDYIGREGQGEVHTDDGDRVQGKGFEKALLNDWDLDLEAHRRHSERALTAGRRPPKLVHNLSVLDAEGHAGR